MSRFTIKRQILRLLFFSFILTLFINPNEARCDTNLNLGVKKSYFDKIITKTTTISSSKTITADDGLPLYFYVDKDGNQFLLKEGSDGYLISGTIALSMTGFDRKTSVVIVIAFISGCSNKWTINQISEWLPELVSGADTIASKDENGLFVTSSLGRNFTDDEDALVITVWPSNTYEEEAARKAKEKKDAIDAKLLLAKLKADVAKAEKERLAEEKKEAAEAAKAEKEEKARLTKEKAKADKIEKKRLDEEKKLAEQKQKEERLGKTFGLTVKDLYSAVSSLGFKSTTTTKDTTTKVKRYTYVKGASLLIIEESEDVFAKEAYAIIDDNSMSSDFLNSSLSKLTSAWSATDVAQILSAVQTKAKKRENFSYQVKNLSIVVSFTEANTTTIKISPLYPELTQSVEDMLRPPVVTAPTSAPTVSLSKLGETATPSSIPTSEPATQAVAMVEPSSLPTSIAATQPDIPKSYPAVSKEPSSGLSLAATDKQKPEEKAHTFKHPWLVFGTGSAVVLGSATAVFLLLPVPLPQTGLGNFTAP